MGLTLLLFLLFAVLFAFLVWRRVPRQHLFWVLLMSAWIYALSFFLTLRGVDAIAPRLTDGFVPYLPPVIPVGVFVAWALHRMKVMQG